MTNVLRFSNILASINYLYTNIITEATAHGSSSERDKWILNFLFLKIFFKFFKDFPFIWKLGSPDILFLISTSRKLSLLWIPSALNKASLAANLLAKQLILLALFSHIFVSNLVNILFLKFLFFLIEFWILLILTISGNTCYILKSN